MLIDSPESRSTSPDGWFGKVTAVRFTAASSVSAVP